MSAVVDVTSWQNRRDEHRRRVEEVIGPYLRSRRNGRQHPVLDFLFTYYSSRPAHIRRWHPGFGVTLADADAARGFLRVRGYQRVADGVRVDPDMLQSKVGAVAQTLRSLESTAARTPRFGCFGLHEWAMVYRATTPRHDLPLRLGTEGTDAVVEAMPLRCTHFDAFRFFTAAAEPRNETPLVPADRHQREQPGCLHTTMDLYRSCFRLAPLIETELTLRAFELARDARELDMRASPYDLSAHGYQPVPVETAAGRAEYVREQNLITQRGTQLRTEICGRLRELLIAAECPTAH